MIEEKIKEMGFNLQEAPKPVAAYIPALEINNMVFTAGQIPSIAGELLFKGKVGKEVTLMEGQRAAKHVY